MKAPQATHLAGARAQLGFTLVEMLVALVLMALISVGIAEGIRFGRRTYAQVTKVNVTTWDLFVAQRFLRQSLENTYPFQPKSEAGAHFGLEGELDRVEFTAPAALATGSASHRRYEVLTGPDPRSPGRQNVWIRSQMDRHGASENLSADVDQEVLIANIASVEWAYAASYEAANDDEDGGPQWQTSWRAKRLPPALVRLRVSFPDGDTRYWPELVIAPKITRDAQCAFDVVAQDCRGSR